MSARYGVLACAAGIFLIASAGCVSLDSNEPVGDQPSPSVPKESVQIEEGYTELVPKNDICDGATHREVIYRDGEQYLCLD